MRVTICTYAAARSDFVAMHYAMIKKFVTHPFDYIVFSNCAHWDTATNNDIKALCKKLNVRCFDYTGMMSDNAINASFQNVLLGEPCDILLMMHFDMFPLKPFSAVEIMRGYDLCGYPEGRGKVNYLWPALLFFNMASLPDKKTIRLGGGTVNGQVCDVGGQIALYLSAHPELRVRHFFGGGIADKKHMAACFSPDIAEKYDPGFGFQVYEQIFLHYKGATNWDNSPESFVNRKMSFLNEILARSMADEPIFK